MDYELELRDRMQAHGLPPEPANLRMLAQLQAAAPRGEAWIFNRFLQHLLPAMAAAGSPERVLVGFQRLLLEQAEPVELLRGLARRPRGIEILARLFAGSQFLTEILLRCPAYLERLQDYRRLAYRYDREAYLSAGRAAMADPQAAGSGAPEAQLEALRAFQRWELLRIGVCDILGLLDLPSVTGQLALLAECVAQISLEIAGRQTATPLEGYFVLGMGKLGGGELNYSSDIDLLFLAQADAARYLKLSERLIHALVNQTAQGFLYRVDMRLRPWGSVGALVSSVDGYLGYLERHARLWEKQALLKAHPIAGDLPAGAAFLERVAPYLFASGLSPAALRSSILEMKQRTEAQLRRRGQASGEVKLGEGSIRDVEFVAQYLQLRHGTAHPQVRSRSTLQALARLAEVQLLRPADATTLASGYTFFRAIEHHLQMMDYRQTHRMPEDPAALAALGQRLGFQGPSAGSQLLLRYQQHSRAVRAIYLGYIGSEAEMDTTDPQHPQPANEPPGLRKHLARLDPAYETTFSSEDIHRHAHMADRLDSTHLVELDACQLEDQRWRVTIVAYDYPGELSLICGLMFVHGLNIEGGEVFTYEPAAESAAPP
ncbi:MAG: hypothetical protein ACKOC5_14140, partial [Chloroflexota bacterium]